VPEEKKRRRRRRRGKGRGGNGPGPGIDRDEMAQDYGFTLAFLRSDDELWDLFNKAVKQTWDAGKFVAELKETKWFRTNSASTRQAITLKYTDPATYRQQLEQMRGTVRDTYGALLGTGASPKFVQRVSETAVMMGWNEQQLTDHLVNSVNFRKLLKKKRVGGTAAQLQLQVEQAARSYGVHAGRDFMARHIESVLNGNDTIDGVVNRLKNQAMSRYSAFADEIKGGATVQEIADPYVQTMAQLLEMNPSQVDMFTPKIQRALQARNKEGKPRPLSLHEFEDVVRQDKRWLDTDNAREQYATVASELLKSFGLRA
jgi:hypothetical protein